jgi:ribosomal protein L18E
MKTTTPTDFQISEMIEVLRHSAKSNPNPINLRMCDEAIAALERREPAALARLARSLREEKVGA